MSDSNLQRHQRSSSLDLSSLHSSFSLSSTTPRRVLPTLPQEKRTPTDIAVLLCQRRFRTKKLKKTIKQLSKIAVNRKKVINELVNTEQQYVDDLNMVSDVFITYFQKKQLLKDVSKNLSSPIQNLFNNIVMISKFNAQLLSALKQAYHQHERGLEKANIFYQQQLLKEQMIEMENVTPRKKNASLGGSLKLLKPKSNKRPSIVSESSSTSNNTVVTAMSFGEAIKKIIPFLKIYVSYLNQFESATAALREVRKQVPLVDQYLKKCKETNPACRGLDIQSFLVTPIQRIPRYELLLKELIKCTPSFHVDFKNITESYNLVVGVNTHLNEERKKKESIDKIMELTRRLEQEGSNNTTSTTTLINNNSATNTATTNTTTTTTMTSNTMSESGGANTMDSTNSANGTNNNNSSNSNNNNTEENGADNDIETLEQLKQLMIQPHRKLIREIKCKIMKEKSSDDVEEEQAEEEESLQHHHSEQISLQEIQSSSVSNQRKHRKSISHLWSTFDAFLFSDMILFLEKKKQDRRTIPLYLCFCEVEWIEKSKFFFLKYYPKQTMYQIEAPTEKDAEHWYQDIQKYREEELNKIFHNNNNNEEDLNSSICNTVIKKEALNKSIPEKRIDYLRIKSKFNQAKLEFTTLLSQLQITRDKAMEMNRELQTVEQQTNLCQSYTRECYQRLKRGFDVMQNYSKQMEQYDTMLLQVLRNDKNILFKLFGEPISWDEFEFLKTNQDLQLVEELLSKHQQQQQQQQSSPLMQPSATILTINDNESSNSNQMTNMVIKSLENENIHLKKICDQLHNEVKQKKQSIDTLQLQYNELIKEKEVWKKQLEEYQSRPYVLQEQMMQQVQLLQNCIVQLNQQHDRVIHDYENQLQGMRSQFELFMTHLNEYHYSIPQQQQQQQQQEEEVSSTGHDEYEEEEERITAKQKQPQSQQSNESTPTIVTTASPDRVVVLEREIHEEEEDLVESEEDEKEDKEDKPYLKIITNRDKQPDDSPSNLDFKDKLRKFQEKIKESQGKQRSLKQRTQSLDSNQMLEMIDSMSHTPVEVIISKLGVEGQKHSPSKPQSQLQEVTESIELIEEESSKEQKHEEEEHKALHNMSSAPGDVLVSRRKSLQKKYMKSRKSVGSNNTPSHTDPNNIYAILQSTNSTPASSTPSSLSGSFRSSNDEMESRSHSPHVHME